MPLVVGAFPVLPGKEEDIRRFAAEMADPRCRDAEQFYKSFGVARENWHYQETPFCGAHRGLYKAEWLSRLAPESETA